jgi:hypothetical protein
VNTGAFLSACLLTRRASTASPWSPHLSHTRSMRSARARRPLQAGPRLNQRTIKESARKAMERACACQRQATTAQSASRQWFSGGHPSEKSRTTVLPDDQGDRPLTASIRNPCCIFVTLVQ